MFELPCSIISFSAELFLLFLELNKFIAEADFDIHLLCLSFIKLLNNLS